jgi:hypothetical protein
VNENETKDRQKNGEKSCGRLGTAESDEVIMKQKNKPILLSPALLQTIMPVFSIAFLAAWLARKRDKVESLSPSFDVVVAVLHNVP